MDDDTVSAPIKEVADTLGGDVRIAPAQGIAAIALSMAMKYHDISTVQDGALYQQYKLEGKNMMPLNIGLVFETAAQIERHLMASSERIAGVVIDALTYGEDGEDEQPATATDGQT
jgi:hypothetical protein